MIRFCFVFVFLFGALIYFAADPDGGGGPVCVSLPDGRGGQSPDPLHAALHQLTGHQHQQHRTQGEPCDLARITLKANS